MDNYEFVYYDKDGHVTRYEQDVSSDHTIRTYHKLCKRFAIALGYIPSRVEEYFGEDYEEDWNV